MNILIKGMEMPHPGEFKHIRIYDNGDVTVEVDDGEAVIAHTIPAADVRPVVRGKWTLFGRRGIYGVMYECSACHAKYDGRTNFCPNCGAEMEGN